MGKNEGKQKNIFPYPWPPNKYSSHRLIGDESSVKRMSGEGGKKRRMTFWVTDIGWRVAFYCEPLTEKEEKERTSQFNAKTKRARGLLRDGRCCTTSIGRQALTLCKCGSPNLLWQRQQIPLAVSPIPGIKPSLSGHSLAREKRPAQLKKKMMSLSDRQ